MLNSQNHWNITEEIRLVTNQIPLHQARYLLDECVPIGYKEATSKEYLELKEILPTGTSDHVILDQARKLGLIVITMDIKFILSAMIQNHDIIYQNKRGYRFYMHSLSKLIEKDCNQKSFGKRITKHLLRNDVIIIP